jgi:hypothetical protein
MNDSSFFTMDTLLFSFSERHLRSSVASSIDAFNLSSKKQFRALQCSKCDNEGQIQHFQAISAHKNKAAPSNKQRDGK